MRLHLSLSLAAALAASSVAPVAAGTLNNPIDENPTAVAPLPPVSSLGSLGGGAGLAAAGLLIVGAIAAGSSSTTTTP